MELDGVLELSPLKEDSSSANSVVELDSMEEQAGGKLRAATSFSNFPSLGDQFQQVFVGLDAPHSATLSESEGRTLSHGGSEAMASGSELEESLSSEVVSPNLLQRQENLQLSSWRLTLER